MVPISLHVLIPHLQGDVVVHLHQDGNNEPQCPNMIVHLQPMAKLLDTLLGGFVPLMSCRMVRR